MKNCISRFCLLALLLLMTIAPVRAEIIGQTTENEYIHRLIADNGQELCFVSGEKDPYLCGCQLRRHQRCGDTDTARREQFRLPVFHF